MLGHESRGQKCISVAYMGLILTGRITQFEVELDKKIVVTSLKWVGIGVFK